MRFQIHNKNYHVRNCGFSTVAAMSIMIAMFVVTVAIYEYVRTDVKLGINLERENLCINMAFTGAQETMGMLATNADLYEWSRIGDPTHVYPDTDGYYFITQGPVDDPHGNKVGYYRSKARSNYLTYLNQKSLWSHYQVYTEGYVIDKKGNLLTNTKEVVYSFCTIDDIGQYCLAIQNSDLTIAAGANLQEATVYGRNIRFVDVSETVKISEAYPIHVKRADYFESFSPSQNLSLYNDKEIIINPNYPNAWRDSTSKPTQVAIEKRFPTLEQGDFDYYKNEAAKQPTRAKLPNGVVNFTSGHPVVAYPLYPPYCPGGNCGSGGPKTTFVYYQDDENGIINVGGVKIYGQVVIVTKGKIVIKGDIVKLNSDTVANNYSYFYSNTHDWQYKLWSKAHQLVLMAGQGIFIDASFMSYTSLDGDPLKLTVQAYIICPRNTLTVDKSALNPDPTTLSFEFLGAMVVDDTPYLADFFKNTTGGINPRILKQDDSLFNYPPPIRRNITTFAQFHYPGGNALVFEASPDISYTPVWTETETETPIP